MVAPLAVDRFEFAAGARPGEGPLEVLPGGVVVLVGPNNSGKSLTLREIEQWCWGEASSRQVVASVRVRVPPDVETLRALAQPWRSAPPPGTPLQEGYFYLSYQTYRGGAHVRQHQVREATFPNFLADGNLQQLRSILLPAYTIRLDGRTRFELSEDKEVADLRAPPQSSVHALFVNDAHRHRLRELLQRPFPNQHLVIDATSGRTLRMRLSSTPPPSLEVEQSLAASSRAFHDAAAPLVSQSDGMRAYVGLLAAVLSAPHRTLLVDEPEAFLHPPLARVLGLQLATLVQERDATMVVATHSSSFLLGCIESGAPTQIVRLTHDRGTATARAISQVQLKAIMQQPMMRSAGVMAALFHKSAVVTESDSDRSFYDEVNKRLNDVGRGVEDAVFLNANGRESLSKIVGPLRQLGIPAAAIADLDMIRAEAGAFEDLLAACLVPTQERPALRTTRELLKVEFARLNVPGVPDPIKRQGLQALGPGFHGQADAWLQSLAQYGLFLPPSGELESWLLNLGATGKSSAWVRAVFAAMGSDPTDAGYVRPQTNDVWGFIDSIRAWTRNPARLGC